MELKLTIFIHISVNSSHNSSLIVQYQSRDDRAVRFFYLISVPLNPFTLKHVEMLTSIPYLTKHINRCLRSSWQSQ